MNTIEFIIKDDGIIRRDISESALSVTNAVITELAKGVSMSYRNAATFQYWEKDLPCSVCITPAHAFWTIPIKTLPLRAPFRAITGGIIIPNFTSPTDPVMTLSWVAPTSMRICTVIRIAHTGAVLANRHLGEMQWLFAYNPSGAAYRLPLSNLYEDCRLCTGSGGVVGSNTSDVIKKMMETMASSEWKNDLWYDVELTQRMFRYKALEKGFEQLPVDGDWEKLCRKVSSGIGQYILV